MLDRNYINRLQAIREYTNSSISKFYSKIYNHDYNTSYYNINVYIHYQDEKYIEVGSGWTVYVFDENSDVGITIESYWRNLND